MPPTSSITVSITDGPTIALSNETLETNAEDFSTQAVHRAYIKLIDAASKATSQYICYSAALYSTECSSDSSECLELQRDLLERVWSRLGGTHELCLDLAVEVAAGLREWGLCFKSLFLLQWLHTIAENSQRQESITCVRILLEYGIACFSLGWNGAAAPRLTSVLLLAEAKGYMAQATVARLHLAFIYEADGYHDEALKMCQQVLEWAEKNDNDGFVQEAKRCIRTIRLNRDQLAPLDPPI